MLFSVLDRVMLLSVLPKEGHLVELRIVRNLQNELSFSEDEIKECTIDSTEKGCFWQKNIDKEIELGEKAISIIRKRLEELNKTGKLHMDMLSLAEKFIPTENE